MPTRIPIYRDDMFARMDEDKKELQDKLNLIKDDVEFLIKAFDKVIKPLKNK